MKNPFRVLHVDDEEDNLEALEINCGNRWKITSLQTPRPLYDGTVSIQDFDVLFLDLVFIDPKDQGLLRRPDPSEGLRVLKWVQEHRPQMPVMIVTGIIERELEISLRKLGPWLRYFEKPVNFGEKGFTAMVEEFVAALSKPLT
jgi:DNA-binding NtrC family response regulator